MSHTIGASTLSGTTVYRLSGVFDLTARTTLDDLLQRLVADPPGRLVLDLAEVEFLDARSIAVLRQLSQRLRSDAVTVDTVAAPFFARLLRLAGYAHRVSPSLEAALRGDGDLLGA